MYFIADVPVQSSYHILRPWNLSLLSQTIRLRSRDALSSNNKSLKLYPKPSTPPPSTRTKTKRHHLRKSQSLWVRKDTYAEILVIWQRCINDLSTNQEKVFYQRHHHHTHNPHTQPKKPPPSFPSIYAPSAPHLTAGYIPPHLPPNHHPLPFHLLSYSPILH